MASGHVLFIDAKIRTPVACVRTEPGVGNVRQAHAVWSSPDDRFVLVANQNGKKFERIAADDPAGRFQQQPAATLNLATCTAPNHLPCQEPTLRPDNAPIGWVIGNGGGGNAANLDGWYLYRVPVAGPAAYAAANPPNHPLPQPLAHDLRSNRDAHGTTRTGGGGGDGKYVWCFDRLANVVEVFRADTGQHVQTVNIADPAISTDPTPDLVAASPDGRFVDASLRGPNPLSGDPHASLGSSPGLLVIEVLHDGRGLAVRGLAPISNIDAAGIERADGHGVQWRRK